MTGWTWDHVEETMTMPRLKAMYGEWRKNPPIPLMVAAYLGFKPAEETKSEHKLTNEFLNLPEFEE